jgi:hypothetical protein
MLFELLLYELLLARAYELLLVRAAGSSSWSLLVKLNELF